MQQSSEFWNNIDASIQWNLKQYRCANPVKLYATFNRSKIGKLIVHM